MVFYDSYATMWREPSPEDLAMTDAFVAMIKVGWARPDSAFRRVFTSMMIPGATDTQMCWLDELQRVCVSTDNAVASYRARSKADSADLLPQIQVPTLVLHSRDDQMNDFDDSVYLASHIEKARLVALESSNHIILGDEPAWSVFVAEVEEFMKPERVERPAGGRRHACSRRASWTCSPWRRRVRTTTRSHRR